MDFVVVTETEVDVDRFFSAEKVYVFIGFDVLKRFDQNIVGKLLQIGNLLFPAGFVQGNCQVGFSHSRVVFCLSLHKPLRFWQPDRDGRRRWR